MYGHRARIGYTSPPAATEVFPYEFYRIVPDGVTLALTTLAIRELTAEEVDRSREITLEAARHLAEAGVDLVVFGGVPINLSRGAEALASEVADTARAIGVPVTSSIEAQLAALKALAASKVGVVHPFGTDHDSMYDDALRGSGMEMVACEAAGLRAAALGRTPSTTPERLARALAAANPAIDTLYFPCPHWAIVEIIDPLEAELGVNVVTALQAIVWRALRRCGVDDRIDGYGRLLAAR